MLQLLCWLRILVDFTIVIRRSLASSKDLFIIRAHGTAHQRIVDLMLDFIEVAAVAVITAEADQLLLVGCRSGQLVV